MFRLDALGRIGELAQEERPFAVVTVTRTESSTSARVGNRAVVLPDGSVEGWVGGGCIQPTARREALAALEEGEPRIVRITPDVASTQPGVRMSRMTCASEGTVDLYVEPSLPRPTLAVAGNSPVVRTLAAITPPLGFKFMAVGEASELNGETVPYPRDTWLVVATFGEFDEDAVEVGVRLGLPYVGLVASKKRAARVLSELRARGLGEEALEVVRSPAGLPLGIGGREEGISLSIMTEIFTRRAGSRSALPEEPAAWPPAEATDPVCGMAVEVEGARHVSEQGGERYYFCCPHCKRAFEAEPEKYLGRIPA